MIRRPPRSTLFPTRRSSDLLRSRRAGRGSEFPPPGSGTGSRRWELDRKSTRLNSSHDQISYAVFCLKKKKKKKRHSPLEQIHKTNTHDKCNQVDRNDNKKRA